VGLEFSIAISLRLTRLRKILDTLGEEKERIRDPGSK
jgi:hypothetical protein